jgi:hypothetical protein
MLTEGEAANLDRLHANPIYKLAMKLSTPGKPRRLQPNEAVTRALAEAERLAADGNRAWAQALVDWRAWRFEP